MSDRTGGIVLLVYSEKILHVKFARVLVCALPATLSPSKSGHFVSVRVGAIPFLAHMAQSFPLLSARKVSLAGW